MRNTNIETEPTNLGEKGLIAAITFFAFTPFFSFFPIHTDVQPIVFILICLFGISHIRSIRFSRLELAFIAVAILSFVYVDPENPYFTFRESMGLSIAFVTYWFFYSFQRSIKQNLVIIAVLFNFAAVLFHFLNPLFFSETLGLFVREIKILDVSGARGASGLAAEPGFMGGLAVFYVAVAFYNKDYMQDRNYFYISLFLSLVIIGLTKSGTGALLLLVFIVARSMKFKVLPLVGGGAIILFLFWLATNYPQIFGRAGSTVRKLMLDPGALFLADSSVGARVINILIGLLSVFENPFGSGAGSYAQVGPQIVKDYGLNRIIEGKSGNISAFAKYSVELGLIFWFLLFLLGYRAIKRSGWGSIPYLMIAFFYISASFSIIFPPTWIIFSLLHQRR